MFNVATIKNTLLGIAIISTIPTFYSCGNSSEKANEADSLYEQAQLFYDNSEYELSLVMIDSLKNAYPKEIDLNRKGLHLRTLNQEKIIEKEILATDSLIHILGEENKQLNGDFKFVKQKDMVEGYYVHKTIVAETENVDRSGLEPRISEDGLFYIVSYLTGRDIKHTAIKLSSNNGSVTSATVPYDKAQNYRYTSDGVTHEMVTFYNQQCDTLGQFALDNSNNLKLTYIGGKPLSMTLTKKHANAIAETYKYAKNKRQGKEAVQKHMYLEKKLEIARKQVEQTKIAEK